MRGREAEFAAREADWRNGAVVYQVLVDRFVPADDLEAKRALYPAPRRLRHWDELPTRGEFLPGEGLWSHELDFWGGDLRSLRTRLDYVQRLAPDVLYLNPIHDARSNHKYDASDYLRLAPEFGDEGDFDALVADLRSRGMKLVLDGVFNHMGRGADLFRDAEADPASRWRDWFTWDKDVAGGVRCWMGARNLPELRLENPAVRDYLYGNDDAVVQSWLRRGADGWRLDVAYDLGPGILGEITAAAHACKPGSLVVGEMANYPGGWFPHVDAVLGFTLRGLILRLVRGELPPRTGVRMLARLVADAGIGPMLKSWLYLDNHDTPRLATALPDPARRRLAQVLQFTLPGSPCLYYGSELGMTGGEDPQMRAPMRWDLATGDNPELRWMRQLSELREWRRGLRIGDFRGLETTELLGFERHTDRVEDSVFVLANPGPRAVTEWVMLPDARVMNMAALVDLLDPDAAPVVVESAFIPVTLPAGGVRVLAPDTRPDANGYTPYKRIP